jgi:hypothetical protein
MVSIGTLVWSTWAMVVKWLGCVAMLTFTYASMKELIAYDIWHGVMWLGGEDQDKAWLQWTGCKCEGQVRVFKATNHTWWGSLSKDLARWTRQWRRANKVAIDEPIRSHDNMKWLISFKEDQAKCWLVLMIKRLDEGWCLCGIKRWNGMHKAKVYLIGHYILPVKGV